MPATIEIAKEPVKIGISGNERTLVAEVEGTRFVFRAGRSKSYTINLTYETGSGKKRTIQMGFSGLGAPLVKLTGEDCKYFTDINPIDTGGRLGRVTARALDRLSFEVERITTTIFIIRMHGRRFLLSENRRFIELGVRPNVEIAESGAVFATVGKYGFTFQRFSQADQLLVSFGLINVAAPTSMMGSMTVLKTHDILKPDVSGLGDALPYRIDRFSPNKMHITLLNGVLEFTVTATPKNAGSTWELEVGGRKFQNRGRAEGPMVETTHTPTRLKRVD